jgi:DNA-binding Lrp family transcriptional regulator
MSNRRVDATDERIVRLLVRNARLSYREIGSVVGLSANAVAQRMRRLEGAGLIRAYTAVLDPGLDPARAGVLAVVQVHTGMDALAADMEAAFAAMPAVVEVLDLAGPVDYEVRLRCRDHDELHAAVQAVRAVPGVTAMETRVVLRNVLRR